MRIPKYDLRCDLVGCVCLIENELELISDSFIAELNKATGYEFDHVFLTIMTELATSSILATYTGFDPDNDYICVEAELEDEEFDYILSMIA